MRGKLIAHLQPIGAPVPDRCAQTGKCRFETRERAQHEIDRIQATSVAHNVPRRAYFCEHCAGWHLTARSR